MSSMLMSRMSPLRPMVVRSVLKNYPGGYGPSGGGSSILGQRARHLNYYCLPASHYSSILAHHCVNKVNSSSSYNVKQGSLDSGSYPAVLMIRSSRIHSSSSLGGEGGESSSKPPSSKVEQTVKVLEDELDKSKQGLVKPAKRPLYKRIQDEVRV